MGFPRYDPAAYTSYARATAHHTTASYTASNVDPLFDPLKFKLRESVKSDLNPHPTPIIVACDVSGSMGILAEACRRGLGTLFEEILKRDPVTDPQVLGAAIDDMEVHAPGAVQFTQFESDPVTVAKQIEKLYLVGRGGGNDHESYLAPLYFAGMRTTCDAFKEGRKGFLFTVGDEEPQLILHADLVRKYFGDTIEADLTAEALITMIQRDWHYFHLIVEEGSYASAHLSRTTEAWQHLLGERAVGLADHTKLAEVIISLIQAVAGHDKDAIIRSWSGDTSLVVAKALSKVPVKGDQTKVSAGPVAL